MVAVVLGAIALLNMRLLRVTMRMTLSDWRRGSAFVGILMGALLTLTACDQSAELLVAEAQALYAAGNFPAADAKVSAALSRDPNNIAARLLSAEIYLDLGQGNAALGLLARAEQAGADKLTLAKPRVEAALIAQHYQDVIRYTETPPTGLSERVRASLLAFRSAALSGVGRAAEAKAVLEQSLALDPHSVDARVVATEGAIGRGDLDAARRDLADAAREAPKDRRLPQLRGNIAYSMRDFAEAAKIFGAVLEAEPWNDLARGELAASQIAENKLSEAKATLEAVLGDAGPRSDADVQQNPLLVYLHAVIAARQNDYRTVQSDAESVIKEVPQFEPARLLAGAASYQLREYERANYYLSPFVAQNEQDVRGHILLAATQLQLGQPADAAKTLMPLRDKANEDPDLPRLIGVAAARSGDTATADRYLKLALGQRPDDWSLRAELAAAQVADDPEVAIGNFEKVVKARPNVVGPQLQLFVALMQTKEYDKALAIADQLIKSEPKSPVGQLLAAAVYMTQRNFAAAQAAFLQARKIRPDDVSANLNLARLALADHKPGEARQYYQGIIDAHPHKIQGYLALAELEVQNGHQEAAQTVLRTGIAANPTDPAITVALLRLQVIQGQAQQAAVAGEQARTKFPRNPALLEVIGQAELAAGERDKALSTFTDLVQIAPKLAAAHASLAEAYLAKYTPDTPQWDAINEAVEATKLAPHDEAAKLLLARILVIHRRFAEAHDVVHTLKTTDPDDIQVTELEGVIASGLKQLPEAVAAFARAVKFKDNALDRRRLAEAEIRLGQVDEAGQTLKTWLDMHPEDPARRREWADRQVKDGRFAEAGAQYAELVIRQPKDPVLHNNLAWVLAQMDQSDAALAQARAAVALSDSADFLDTLGYVLLRTGKSREAAEALQKAWQQDSSRTNIGFHLSEAFAAAGKKTEAVALLHTLLERKTAFAERVQAEDLLNKLGE